MKLRCAFLLGALACCAMVVTAEQESKYNEIIKLLSDTEQLKPAAQSYSASVADPNDYPSSGYSRASERTRYSPSSSSSSKNDDDEKKVAEDEEEDKKPDRLALLLAESKFACESLKNGYYADESVGCQVFHYCVDGVKHSWQCPENTVFHQIHLNCVPNTQDICRESSKFHVVNDYLHKELNERGPNNTILYHQRFYPEGFDVSGGDTVTQIFQAQAAAALQKSRDRDSETADYEDEQPRPRSRPKQQYTPSSQAVRQQSSRPVYKQPASRPVPASSYQPQPVPTKRPVSYTTPEAYTPPSYTESSNDDYNSNDFASPSGSSSSSSSGLGSSSGFSSGTSGSNYSPSNPSSSSSFSSPSHSSHSSHSQPSSSYRPTSSSRPSYPTRSLGIPIASFRVAPSSSNSGYSPVGAQASTIREVNVPLNMPITFANQPLHGFHF